jgi:hypothetical protein
MADDSSINIVDGLKGQYVQLRRLLAQQSWIARASRDTLSEIETQLTQIKSVVAELERIIVAQLVALRDQETVAQMTDRRELYRSPNGDCWFLVRDPTSGHGFVVHEPNAPSGGRPSRIEIADFLRANANGPEHQALLRVIGGVVQVPL